MSNCPNVSISLSLSLSLDERVLRGCTCQRGSRSALKLGTDAQLSASLPRSPTLNLVPMTSVLQIHIISEKPSLAYSISTHTYTSTTVVTRNGLWNCSLAICVCECERGSVWEQQAVDHRKKRLPQFFFLSCCYGPCDGRETSDTHV